ncbi:tRNA1(Val) (adenine(37)-N6)-methyltransferase [Mucilaginibacter sp.]|jgi:tRNA1Val (adenine37-N6)-methyltransferase|uniref:tRNA1(Val) (adenine(37)-N6)-methyltransferase n=1 Tax=Mucilaginibacter sp. TaxID=1882438 RepID=UPI003561AF3D
MKNVFKFKQFNVDQTNCAMKINTDGVLLGALTEANDPQSILDIGTGTGVIALMLAQRFTSAKIDAVEIDEDAAETARENFNNSPFIYRIIAYTTGFESFFEQYPHKKFDLIVSNPPFFLNSLESPGIKKNLARHTDEGFYKKLITAVAEHLTETGTCQLILPVPTANLVKGLLPECQLHLQKQISICSFPDDAPHREILIIGNTQTGIIKKTFVIYDHPKVYSVAYQNTLKEFFTIF